MMQHPFKHRSSEKERIDESGIPRELFYRNLQELDFLNRKTGGHALSLKGLKRLLLDPRKTYHIVDLGCGSGDALKTFAEWARNNRVQAHFTGVDMNEQAIDFLKAHCAKYPEITGITTDYQTFMNENKDIDIVHCSLFCHHLKDQELSDLFTSFRQQVKTGFVINDLQRHWLAYWGAWLFTRLANGTTLAKNDGPISVLRGFKMHELDKLLVKANIPKFTIEKTWTFRFLITAHTNPTLHGN